MSNEKKSFTGWMERPLWQRTVIVIALFVSAIVLMYLLTSER